MQCILIVVISKILLIIAQTKLKYKQMKYALNTFLFLLVMLTASAQKTGQIYYMQVAVEDELVENFSMSKEDGTFFTEYSERDEFPQDLADSVKKATAHFLSQSLNADVSAFYPKDNKPGVTFFGVDGYIPGLPKTNFKKASESTNSDYYIKIVGDINSGNIRLNLGTDDRFKKYKPRIKLTVKVYDKNKNKVWKKKIKLKKFGKLNEYNGKMVVFGNMYDYSKSETLSPLDISMIYLTALEEML